MPDNFVDLILTDPPYGETGNKWDKHIDFKAWFVELERILKPTGAIVFTSSTLLASKLIPLAPHLYKMCGNAVTTNVVENVMKGLTPCLTRIV